MNEQDFRRRLDAELSPITWTDADKRRVMNGIHRKGGIIVNKKISVVLMAVLALLALTVTAYAAGLLFSPRADATALADRALEETYGVTLVMQDYFTRETQTLPDGGIAVQYRGQETLSYVLGEYTVVVRNGKVEGVSWSRDGESTEGGFSADAWGAAQLGEMLRLNEADGNMSGFMPYVDRINAKHGLGNADTALAPAGRSEAEADEWEQIIADIEAKAKLDGDALDALAQEAIIARYDLTQAQAEMLLQNEEGSFYPLNGQPCYCVQFFLVQHPDPVYRDVSLEWVEKDGTYTVYVNVETGVIEDVFYATGLTGNG